MKPITFTGIVVAALGSGYVVNDCYETTFGPTKYQMYHQIDNITQIIRENDGYIIVNGDKSGSAYITKYCSKEVGDPGPYRVMEIDIPEEVKEKFRNKPMLNVSPGTVSIYKDLPQGSRGFAHVIYFSAWKAAPCKKNSQSTLGEHVEIHLPPNQDITFH